MESIGEEVLGLKGVLVKVEALCHKNGVRFLTAAVFGQDYARDSVSAFDRFWSPSRSSAVVGHPKPILIERRSCSNQCPGPTNVAYFPFSVL